MAAGGQTLLFLNLNYMLFLINFIKIRRKKKSVKALFIKFRHIKFSIIISLSLIEALITKNRRNAKGL